MLSLGEHPPRIKQVDEGVDMSLKGMKKEILSDLWGGTRSFRGSFA